MPTPQKSKQEEKRVVVGYTTWTKTVDGWEITPSPKLKQAVKKSKLKSGINEVLVKSPLATECWLCGVDGGTTKLTKQHAIPRSLSPKHNFVYPLCRPCHDVVDGYILLNANINKLIKKRGES